MVDKSLTIVGGTDAGDAGQPTGPPHEPTDTIRTKVSILAEAGVTHRAIANDVGISLNTLRKFYMHELLKADAKVQALIGQAQLQVALGAPAQYEKVTDEHGVVHYNMTRAEIPRNVTMLVFLGKSRMGQRDGGPGQIESGGAPADDGLEFNTVGLTDGERTSRVIGLLDIARARRVGRAADGAGVMGAVPGKPATNGAAKPG